MNHSNCFPTPLPSYRRPARNVAPDLPVYAVCPHCKRRVSIQSGGYQFSVTADCPEHGKVSPIPSHVVNRYPALADS